MTELLRLTAYTDATAVGGAELSLGNLLKELDPRIEVSLLGVDERVLDRLASYRRVAEVRIVPQVQSKRDLRGIAAHVRAVRALRPDILQAQLWTPWTGQYGILAGVVVPGVRVIAVEQAPLPSADARQRRFKRLLSSRLAAHVAVGHRAAREVESFAGLPPHSVRTIHNGVPDVPPAAAEEVPRSAPVIGSFGRLHREKAFDDLLRALSAVPEAKLVVAGEGDERHTLERLARELGVADRVELAGWRDDPSSLLPTFDVFVLPSRREGFPLAVVEAMLAGLPVVATDVGSVSEAVIDGETGMLVPPDDVDALTSAIRTLLADDALRKRLGAAARAHAVEHFTSPAMARAYEQLYAEVMS